MVFAGTRPGSALMLYGNCSSKQNNLLMMTFLCKSNKKPNALLSRLTKPLRSLSMVCAPLIRQHVLQHDLRNIADIQRWARVTESLQEDPTETERSLRDTVTEPTAVKQELKKLQVNNLAALSAFKPRFRLPTPHRVSFADPSILNRPSDNHPPPTPMDFLCRIIHLRTTTSSSTALLPRLHTRINVSRTSTPTTATPLPPLTRHSINGTRMPPGDRPFF